MRRLALGIACAGLALALGAPRAHADDLDFNSTTFTVNLSFSGGGTAAGIITIGSECPTCAIALDEFSVTIAGLGSEDTTFDNTNSATGSYYCANGGDGDLDGDCGPPVDPNDPLFNLLQNDPFQLVVYTTIGAGGTQGVTSGFFTDNNGFTTNLNPGGTLTPTPEPATWALFGGGVVLLLGWAWRVRKAGADARA
jgi:hypothetical protein